MKHIILLKNNCKDGEHESEYRKAFRRSEYRSVTCGIYNTEQEAQEKAKELNESQERFKFEATCSQPLNEIGF